MVGCKTQYSNDLSSRVELEQQRKGSYVSNIAKLYIKNNTSRKLYLPAFQLDVTNRLGKEIEYYNSRYDEYLKDAAFNGIFVKNICTCKHYGSLYNSLSNLPPDFLEEAELQELIRFSKHNNIDSSDMKVIKYNASWVDTKYSTHLFFLEPYEDCLVQTLFIDHLPNKQRSRLFYGGIDFTKNKYEKWWRMELRDNKAIEYCHNFLEEIAGY